MIFNQFRDPVSNTLTYILAKSKGSEALIIDPVIDRVDEYLEFIGKNELRLVKALDTHTHADHITGIGELRKLLKCITIMGKESEAELVSVRVSNGDLIKIDGITLEALHTPGHTDESYCFYTEGMVFTGDTLMIRGTGRTDFQNGNPKQQYESITQKLFTLPDSTIVYPGHDYKGESFSTIGIEKRENPRLASKTIEEFTEIMNNLKLANPKMMDIAVPANKVIGKDVNQHFNPELVIDSKEALIKYLDHDKYFYVDLRETEEIEKTGTLEKSLHIPYQVLSSQINDENSEISRNIKNGLTPVYFCAYGERSALALELTIEHKLNGFHLRDGINGWIKRNGTNFIS